MSYRPTTHCRKCDEPLDVYMAYEERYCVCCREQKPLYYCAECGYVGHEYGAEAVSYIGPYEVRRKLCPNQCVYSDGFAEGKDVELIEYDYDDDIAFGSSAKESGPALEAFHAFLNRAKPITDQKSHEQFFVECLDKCLGGRAVS